MSTAIEANTPQAGDLRRVQSDHSDPKSNDPTFDRQRAEMQRLIRTTLALISRGAVDGAAEYARRAAELGKIVRCRWHREPKAASERQSLFEFDAGWTWPGRG